MSPKATKLLKEFAEAFHEFTEIDGPIDTDGQFFLDHGEMTETNYNKKRTAIERYITKLEKRASK